MWGSIPSGKLIVLQNHKSSRRILPQIQHKMMCSLFCKEDLAISISNHNNNAPKIDKNRHEKIARLNELVEEGQS